MKKVINVISLVTIFFNYCKGQNKEYSNVNTNNAAQTIISESGMYYYTPNLKVIDSLKKTMGEKSFYVIADDIHI
ncbi:hypothetical protein AAEO57_18935 [Flavobacterium sp. DGU38]|uniref:Uncharacterized protein n=1 Tax=Flavobacterium calami TaxID=3139144 RepID=A0ABU9IW74_9FLAO